MTQPFEWVTTCLFSHGKHQFQQWCFQIPLWIIHVTSVHVPSHFATWNSFSSGLWNLELIPTAASATTANHIIGFSSGCYYFVWGDLHGSKRTGNLSSREENNVFSLMHTELRRVEEQRELIAVVVHAEYSEFLFFNLEGSLIVWE